MKITIKAQGIDLEYEDEYAKLEPNTAEIIFKLIEKIRDNQGSKCQYCGGITTSDTTARTTIPPQHIGTYIHRAPTFDTDDTGEEWGFESTVPIS